MTITERKTDTVQITRDLWDWRYGKVLSEQDAKEITDNIAGFFDTLERWDRERRQREKR